MNRKPCKIYIYSVLAGLGDAVQEKLPDYDIITYEGSLSFLRNISDELLKEIRSQATVLLSSPYIISKVIEEDNMLQWAHSYSAGLEHLLRHPKAPTEAIITRTGEGFGDTMAEYVVGQMVCNERRFIEAAKSQRNKVWDKMPFVHYRTLSSLTAGILGTGQIGSQSFITVARHLRAFGMNIYGLCREPKHQENNSPFDKIMTGKDLTEFLEDCDYVISVLPSTPETKHMLSGDILQACKKKQAVFINVGRGDVIDNETLEKAIRENWISGAILDTIEGEPLQSDSPLWDLPNVVITPHVSGIPQLESIVNVFVNNLDKFINNLPLDYAFNWSRGY